MKFKFLFTLFVSTISLSAQNITPQMTVSVGADQPASAPVRIDTVYMRTDLNLTKEPSFPGGEQERLKFIQNTLKYPEGSEQETQDKKVVFSFVIAPDGEMRQVRVIQSADFEYDKQALYVMQMMPRWEPGEVKGEKVGVYCIEPIIFKSKNPKAAPKTGARKTRRK